ncbi:MAG: YHS domain-containing protein [Terriglobales bacterium]
MSTDPVCGMEVYENNAPATMRYQGETCYFCSKTCQGTFEDNPQAYLAEKAA